VGHVDSAAFTSVRDRSRGKAQGIWPSVAYVPVAVRIGWAASLRALPEPLFADLVAINDWLARTAGRELPVVPVRYRSAEIFGREKRLDQLLDTTLFAQGRLSLDLLSSVQMAPPIPAAAVGAGDDILVVENSATYWVAVEALRHVRGHTIGAVGWGSGKAFPAQVSSLTVDIAGQGPLRGVVWYWGDYDPPGTAIAATAARMTEEVECAPPPISGRRWRVSPRRMWARFRGR
jgi:hypothetical protein